MGKFSSLIPSLILRRTTLILWCSLLLTLIGGYYTVKLYANLRTDLEELLPRTARSVQDLDEVGRRLPSIDNLAVLVFSKNAPASKRFVIDLATRIANFPKDEVASVEYRIDRELEFFNKHQSLYMDRKDLSTIHDYIEHRIDYERALYNPLNIFSGEQIIEPTLDINAIKEKYASRQKAYSQFPGGFFATPDETKRAILINVAGKTLGITGVKRLKERVVQTIEELRPNSYSADLAVHYSGGVQEMIEEQESLVEDLAISTIAVLVLVGGVLLAFFRFFWLTSALLFSLLCGTVWTFGVSFFAVGYLNANSAFLGSIVLGNGINFGIIFLARYLEERRNRRSHLEANHIAITMTWTATLTAALAAGFSYGSLMLTSFRGFSQFGMIGLFGMAICWLCTYTLLPTLITVVEKIRPIPQDHLSEQSPSRVMTFAAKTVSRWPGIIMGVSTLATILALLSFTQANSSLLETNLRNLRSKASTVWVPPFIVSIWKRSSITF